MAEHKLPEIRKQEIIETAFSLFVEKGVEKTSVTQIAKSVGVAKGLLYYYFKSKDEILEAVVEDLCKDQIQILNESLNHQEYDVLDKVLILLNTFSDIHPYHGLQQSHLMQDDAYLIALFHKRYLSFSEKILDDLIEEGQSQGYFQILHPKLMFVVTLEGLYDLMKMRTLTRIEITDIMEQSLGLPVHSLYERSDSYLTNFY